MVSPTSAVPVPSQPCSSAWSRMANWSRRSGSTLWHPSTSSPTRYSSYGAPRGTHLWERCRMSRKPDIHRVLSRYADLNPPLGYPGGSCHLQDRIRQEVRSERNQGILLDHHLSGADKDPND